MKTQTFRIPDELIEPLAETSTRLGRTISQTLVLYLRWGLDCEAIWPPPTPRSKTSAAHAAGVQHMDEILSKAL